MLICDLPKEANDTLLLRGRLIQMKVIMNSLFVVTRRIFLDFLQLPAPALTCAKASRGAPCHAPLNTGLTSLNVRGIEYG